MVSFLGIMILDECKYFLFSLSYMGQSMKMVERLQLRKSVKVSVIMPAYNSAHTIAASIESVMNQTYRDFELLVVDDGSTDKTGQIAGSYLLKYIKQQNLGAATARNNGIHQATGDLIAFLDSDDTWMPDKLQKTVEIFQNTPAAMVFTNIDFINKDDAVISTTDFESLPTETIRRMLLSHCFIILSSVVISRDVFDNVGMFDVTLSYAEDWDLFYRIARGFPVVNSTETLTRYYLSENSMMRKTDARERLIIDTLKVIDRIYSYPENLSLEREKKCMLSDYFREFGECDVWCGDFDNAKKYLQMSLNYNGLNSKALWLYVKMYLKQILSCGKR